MDIFKVSKEKLQDYELAAVKAVLDSGGVIAFPTETSYALGANPFASDAVKKIFLLKGRLPSKPLLLIISETKDLNKNDVEIPSIFYPLAKEFWPGPLTLVMKVKNKFPSIVKGGGDKLGFRMSGSLISREISRFCGFPITATSANLSGKADSLTAQQVIIEFGEGIDLVVDGGTTPGGCSTILDITQFPPKILRPGLISEKAIKQIWNNV